MGWWCGMRAEARRLLAERAQVIESELQTYRNKLARMIDLYTDGSMGDVSKGLIREKENELNGRMSALESDRRKIEEEVGVAENGEVGMPLGGCL